MLAFAAFVHQRSIQQRPIGNLAAAEQRVKVVNSLISFLIQRLRNKRGDIAALQLDQIVCSVVHGDDQQIASGLASLTGSVGPCDGAVAGPGNSRDEVGVRLDDGSIDVRGLGDVGRAFDDRIENGDASELAFALQLFDLSLESSRSSVFVGRVASLGQSDGAIVTGNLSGNLPPNFSFNFPILTYLKPPFGLLYS